MSDLERMNAVELLHMMFPALAMETINAILAKHNWQMDLAIDELLVVYPTSSTPQPEPSTAYDDAEEAQREESKRKEQEELKMWIEKNNQFQEEEERQEQEKICSFISKIDEEVGVSGFESSNLVDTNMQISEFTKMGDELMQQQAEINLLKAQAAEKDLLLIQAVNLLGEKDQQLKELAEKLEEHEKLLREQQDLISARDETLREKDALLLEKDQLLMEKDTSLAAKDQLILDKDTQLSTQQHLFDESRRKTTEMIQQLVKEAEHLKDELKRLESDALAAQQVTQTFPLSNLKAVVLSRIKTLYSEIDRGIKEEQHLQQVLQLIDKASQTVVGNLNSTFYAARDEVSSWKLLDRVAEFGDMLTKLVTRPKYNDDDPEFQAQLQKALELSQLELASSEMTEQKLEDFIQTTEQSQQ
jgi:hypothetical protein